MTRKTIKVDYLKDKVNKFLLNTDDELKSERLALGGFVESILVENKCYNGFRYLTKEDMEKSDNGISVGINTCDKLQPYHNVDHSRVQYL